MWNRDPFQKSLPEIEVGIFFTLLHPSQTETMFRVLLSVLLASVAFSFSLNRPRAQDGLALQAKSKALPFLDAPPKLDGSTVGDFGFDPLGFTETLNDLSYVRSAELKHGRVAMLATVGFVFQQYVHILSPESNPLKAISALGYGPNLQILFGIGVVELITWKKTFNGDKPGTHLIVPHIYS